MGKTNKQFTQSEKAKRGWWASVVFMLLIVVLIVFLSYVKIVEENRDILIGIIGMLTGSISSMLAIASGRDPSELEELKDKLASANASPLGTISTQYLFAFVVDVPAWTVSVIVESLPIFSPVTLAGCGNLEGISYTFGFGSVIDV